MSESSWFVYRVDGPPIGPVSTKDVAEAILTGKLPPDIWVTAPSGSRWLRATDVPVIAALVEGLPTRRHRDSGMRVIPPAVPEVATAVLPPLLGRDARPETKRDPVTDLDAGDLEAPKTERSVPRGADGFPMPPPPSSSSPTPTPPNYYRGGETLESPQDPAPKKRTLGG